MEVRYHTQATEHVYFRRPFLPKKDGAGKGCHLVILTGIVMKLDCDVTVLVDSTSRATEEMCCQVLISVY